MKNPRDFFESYLVTELGKDPGVIADSGVRSQSVTVDIEGSSGGQWTLAFDGEGMASIKQGAHSKECTISLNEKTWHGLLDGSVNIPWAVMTRKIKIKGDAGLAAKIGIALRKANVK